MPAERKIRIKRVNPHITCRLCRGYFVDATTVTECLHTFCKSCIVKWLEENNTCPQCKTVIHQSHPLQYISFDRTMQDIVFKLIPDLQEREAKREKEFYRKRGLPYVRSPPPMCGREAPIDDDAEQHKDHHRSDEQVNICLECMRDTKIKVLKKRFIRCSSQATVTHLKKFIAKKLYNNLDRYQEVDLLCNEELLGKDHTLKFLFVTRWRLKDPPLILKYRPKVKI